MNDLTQTRPQQEAVRRSTIRAEGLVVLVATGLAVLVWAAAKAAGLDLDVHSGSGTREVGLGSVIVTPLVVGAAAAGLLRLLERRTSRGLRIWTVTAVTVWTLSFLGPLSATTIGAGCVLATPHVVVGAVVVGGLRRAGATVIDPELAGRALRTVANPLTGRERDVLAAAEDGSAIASRLHLSASTVRNYLSDAIGKTGTRNKTEAALLARRNGWL